MRIFRAALLASLLLWAQHGSAAGSIKETWSKPERALLRDLWVGSLRELGPADFPTNPVAFEPRARELGHSLFHDAALSRDGKTACASCHMPERGMSGDRIVDVPGHGPRKPPSLWGVAWQSWFFWDGRKDSLWSQALTPIEAPLEIGVNRAEWRKRVTARHRVAYEGIFGPVPPETSEGTDEFFVNTGRAIAAFEITLKPRPAPFDRYVERTLGLKPSEPASARPSEFPACAVTGLRIFLGKGRCVSCHNGPRLENGEFHATGITALGEGDHRGGRMRGTQFVQGDPFNCRGKFGAKGKGAESACPDFDHMLSGHPVTGNAFKTPTLRNVELSAPYMHNGKIGKLEEVIEHYVRAVQPPGGSEILPLALSGDERAGLVCFLKSLTSER